MKKILSICILVSLLALFGCEKNESVIEEQQSAELYEINDVLLNQNNIKDVVKVFERYDIDNNTAKLYYGNRKGKDWFAIFNNLGSLAAEWYGKNRYYQYQPGERSESNLVLFQQMNNGEYVYVYNFWPENIRQVVFLGEKGNVKYGFELNESISIQKILPNVGFLAGIEGITYLLDLDGKTIANEVNWSPEKSYYMGLQNGNMWIGYYDQNNVWKELQSQEKFEKNRKVHLGYGEYKDYVLSSFWIDGSNSIKMDWGQAFIPSYRSTPMDCQVLDVLLIKDGRIKLVLLGVNRNLGYDVIYNWYNQSIIVSGKYVVSPEGEVKAEYVDNHFVVYDRRTVECPVEPISYEEAIGFGWGIYSEDIMLYNGVKGEIIWNTTIDKIRKAAYDSKKSAILLNKGNQEWLYQCEIVNKDGSKETFRFRVNIENGEVTYE